MIIVVVEIIPVLLTRVCPSRVLMVTMTERDLHFLRMMVLTGADLEVCVPSCLVYVMSCIKLFCNCYLKLDCATVAYCAILCIVHRCMLKYKVAFPI